MKRIILCLSLILFLIGTIAASDEIPMTMHINDVIRNSHSYIYKGNKQYKSHNYASAIDNYTQAIKLYTNYTDMNKNNNLPTTLENNANILTPDKPQNVQLDNSVRNISDQYSYVYRHNTFLQNNLVYPISGFFDTFPFFGKTRQTYYTQQTKGTYYNQLDEVNANYSVAYCNRAKARIQLHDCQKAIEDCNFAIQYNVDNSELPYYYRALAKAKLYDYKEAIKDYKIAIRMNPELGQAYYNLAIVECYIKKYKSAIRHAKRAKKLFKKQGNLELYSKAIEMIDSISQTQQINADDILLQD